MPSDSDIQPLFTGTVYRSRINDISNMSDSDALAGGRFTIAELNTQYKDVVELDRIQSSTFDADSDGVISGFTDFSNTINRMDENHWLQIDSDGYGNNMLGNELDFRPERPGREQPPVYSIGISNFKGSPAIVTGTAEKVIYVLGAVVSADATVVGDGDREMDGTGELAASQSVVVGDGDREMDGTGALAASQSVVDGLSERAVKSISANLQAQPSMVDGLIERGVGGSGTLVSTASIVVGSGRETFLGNGDLVSTASIVEGIAVRSDPYVYMAGTEYVEMTETVYVLDVT